MNPYIEPTFQIGIYLSPALYLTLFRNKKLNSIVSHPARGAFVLGVSFVTYHVINFFYWKLGSQREHELFSHQWTLLPFFIGTLVYARVTQQNLIQLGMVARLRKEDVFVYLLSLSCLIMFFLFSGWSFIRLSPASLVGLFSSSILQEFFFRGALQQAAQAYTGPRAGLLVANLFFVLYHLIPNQILGVWPIVYERITQWFILGLIFGFYQLKTRNLTAVALLHAAYNFYSFACHPDRSY